MSLYDLPSGAVLDVTPLPYGEAWAVAQTVIKEIETLDLKIDFTNMKSFEQLDLVALKGPFCAILSSQKVLEAVQKCFKKCLVEKLKIDGQTFEKPESRKDFLPAAFYAMKENVYPFFDGLLSSLGTK